MRFILTRNQEEPFNLIRRSPAWDFSGFAGMSETAVIDAVVLICKEYGQIPCETETERDACLARFAEAHPTLSNEHFPPVGPHWIVDEADLPGGIPANGIERTANDHANFFDAWEWNDGCKVNMPKARVIHMDRIRTVRDAELLKLDVVYLKALETGDTAEQSRIAALKQELRDIPATFNLSTAKTPATLHSRWPELLSR